MNHAQPQRIAPTPWEATPRELNISNAKTPQREVRSWSNRLKQRRWKEGLTHYKQGSAAQAPRTRRHATPTSSRTSSDNHLWQAMQELQSTIQCEPGLRRRYGNPGPQWDRKGPKSPLSAGIQEVPWLRNFNSAALPQYDGDSDPTEFLLKYEVVVEANNGSNATKAKALVMALKGAA